MRKKKTLRKITKKLSENCKIDFEEQSATRIQFHLICLVVLVFITAIGIKEIECAFSLRFRLKKVHFLWVFYTKLGRNWVLEKWKKSCNSPGKVLEFCFPISVQTLNEECDLTSCFRVCNSLIGSRMVACKLRVNHYGVENELQTTPADNNF